VLQICQVRVINLSIAVDEAIVDSNLVTAAAWPAHPQWLAQLLKVLGTKVVYPEIAVVN